VPKRSAGIVLYRRVDGDTEVLLVHPGGPFFTTRWWGCWSIPKGEYAPGEDPAAVAAREFTEELGHPAPAEPWVDLGEITQAGGKVVRAYAVAGDLDASDTHSNTFTMEWPPRSGTFGEFEEVDRAQWFTLEEARRRMVPAQAALLDRLPA
jgi:predicted NUDIX family NTP pyrophosphohydrolase